MAALKPFILVARATTLVCSTWFHPEITLLFIFDNEKGKPQLLKLNKQINKTKSARG
jgi:hypothetical protein